MSSENAHPNQRQRDEGGRFRSLVYVTEQMRTEILDRAHAGEGVVGIARALNIPVTSTRSVIRWAIRHGDVSLGVPPPSARRGRRRNNRSESGTEQAPSEITQDSTPSNGEIHETGNPCPESEEVERSDDLAMDLDSTAPGKHEEADNADEMEVDSAYELIDEHASYGLPDLEHDLPWQPTMDFAPTVRYQNPEGRVKQIQEGEFVPTFVQSNTAVLIREVQYSTTFCSGSTGESIVVIICPLGAIVAAITPWPDAANILDEDQVNVLMGQTLEFYEEQFYIYGEHCIAFVISASGDGGISTLYGPAEDIMVSALRQKGLSVFTQRYQYPPFDGDESHTVCLEYNMGNPRLFVQGMSVPYLEQLSQLDNSSELRFSEGSEHFSQNPSEEPKESTQEIERSYSPLEEYEQAFHHDNSYQRELSEGIVHSSENPSEENGEFPGEHEKSISPFDELDEDFDEFPDEVDVSELIDFDILS